jgi:putative heme-binding domain-containing protein
LQASFSLGESRDPRATRALADLARKASDPWLRIAVLSSASSCASTLLVDLTSDQELLRSASPPSLGFLEQLATVIAGKGDRGEVEDALRAIARIEGLATQRQLVFALGRPLARAGKPFQPEQIGEASARSLLEKLYDHACRFAVDREASLADRRSAAEFLSCFAPDHARPILVPLLDAREPEEIQMAAIRALSVHYGPTIAETLLAPWRTFSPPVRQEALEVLLARIESTRELLRAAKEGRVALSQLDANRRGLLTKHADPEVRQLATQLFHGDLGTPRAAVVESYRSALSLERNAERGEKVFRRECSTCHRIGDTGSPVGPDLASSAAREPEALLTHILDPNRYVLPTYEQYIVVDDNGRTWTGLIAAQTATSITLRREDNKTDTILRRHIAEMSSTGKSLMPDGFEAKIVPAEMSDLIGYLESVRPAHGDLPLGIGTLPGLIEPDRK